MRWQRRAASDGEARMVATDPWSTVGRAQRRRESARWLRDHRRVARDSLILVSQRFWTSAAGVAADRHRARAAGGLYLVQTNLAAMSDRWEGRPGITVYLRVDADAQVGRVAARRTRRRSRRRTRHADHRRCGAGGVREVHRRQRCAGAPEAQSVAGVVADRDEGRYRPEQFDVARDAVAGARRVSTRSASRRPGSSGCRP